MQNSNVKEMPEKIKSFTTKYASYISVIAATLIFFALLWGIKLKNTYMPIEHRSGVVFGDFKISVGEIRRIDVHTADGKDLETDSIRMAILDKSGNEAYIDAFIDPNGYMITGDLNEDPVTIAEYAPGEGIFINKGDYRIYATNDSGKTLPLIFDIYEYRGSYVGLYLMLILLTIIAEIVIIWTIRNRSLSEQVTFVIIAAVLCIFLNALFPPLSVPDEKLHFKQAYEISSNILHPFNKDKVYSDGHLLIRATDYDSMFYLHSAASKAGWYEGLFGKADKTMVPIDTDVSVNSSGKYAYIPSALGIIISRILGLNGRWLLMSGRLFNMAACLAIVFLAIKQMPMKKWLLILIALIPESLVLINSYSYDGLNLALMLLLTAYFFKLCEQDDPVRKSQILILAAIMLVMLPIKVAYLPVCALVFLLPFKNFKDKKVKYIFAGAVGLSALIIIVFGKLILGRLIPLNTLNNYTTLPGYKVSVGYAIHNIPDILNKYFSTIWFYTNRYFTQIFGSIYGRAIPKDLDIYTMPVILQWILAIVFGTCAVSSVKQKNGIIRKSLIWIIGFMCAMLALAGMLFAATSVDDWRIMGFQGRYYLPALCLAPLAFDITCVKIDDDVQRKICIAGMSFVNIAFWITAFMYYAFNYFSRLV